MASSGSISVPLSGWLAIDKPLHLTSAQVVARIKRLLPRGTKIGHAGTLDPLATGVLPVAIGCATKVIAYATDARKEYVFDVTWGETRDTGDAAGDIIATCDVRPCIDQIVQVLPMFIGGYAQTPPAYSALKIQGKRAYDMVRWGEHVTLSPRSVIIDALELIAHHDTHTTFSVTCGKGTYVRALAQDIAHAMGCMGYVSMLRRTRVGVFHHHHLILLDNLFKIGHNVYEHVLPLDTVLDDIPVVVMGDPRLAQLKNGQAVDFTPADQWLFTHRAHDTWLVKDDNGQHVGLAHVLTEPHRWHLKRGFHHASFT